METRQEIMFIFTFQHVIAVIARPYSSFLGKLGDISVLWQGAVFPHCKLLALKGKVLPTPQEFRLPVVLAQGGGGSFQNRKPIGEIGCCESRMAERIHWWTERWLELCFLEWLQWLQWSPGRSPHPQLLDVVWCSAAVVVVVVWWSCSCGVV